MADYINFNFSFFPLFTTLYIASKIIISFKPSSPSMFVDKLISLVKPAAPASPLLAAVAIPISATDISSVSRSELNKLKIKIRSALPLMKDEMSRSHLQDMLDRITKALIAKNE